ncbi:MAG: cytochrome c oxidase subunit II [Actinobacteria bacterium]|nr:MAG: cytochrome c oxidase subunit II [Actinomycetota bacterium]
MASSVRAKLLLAATTLALLLVPAAYGGNGGFVPVTPESPNAHDIRASYFFITFFTLGVFVLVETLLVVFIFRFRRRRRPRFQDGPTLHGATRLELLWTALPVAILFLIATFIFIELPGISHVPSAGATGRAYQIKVTGRQFYWQFEYPNGVISIDSMRAPADVPVKLTVVSPDTDVIHSWWIPALGGKIDAIPGIVNTTWFEAKPGFYSGQCAERASWRRSGSCRRTSSPPGSASAGRSSRPERRTWVTRSGAACAPSATASPARGASRCGSPGRQSSAILEHFRGSFATAPARRGGRCPPSARAGRASRSRPSRRT